MLELLMLNQKCQLSSLMMIGLVLIIRWSSILSVSKGPALVNWLDYLARNIAEQPTMAQFVNLLMVEVSYWMAPMTGPAFETDNLAA